jgi:Fe-S-cluster containining protein
MKPFECRRCGACCRDFTGYRHVEEHTFRDRITFILNRPHLVLQDWEADLLQKELDAIGSATMIIPSLVFFDMLNSRTIVFTYSIESVECPLLVQNSCSIYRKRPLVCRIYPCVHRLDTLLSGSERRELTGNSLCPPEDEDDWMPDEGVTLRDLEERYGDSFRLNLAYHKFEKAVSGFLQDMQGRGRLRLATGGYDPKHLSKRIMSSPQIGLSALYWAETGKKLQDFFEH